MKEYPSFHEHDASLNLWLIDPKDPAITTARNELVKHLRVRGFKIGIDPHTQKYYPSICRDHHRGAKGALEVKVRLSGRCLEIDFFQNIVRENKNGGEYDFSKRSKMPYLVGKLYELERSKIAALFQSLGLPALSLDITRTGMDFIQHRRNELEAFQGKGFYDPARRQRYNSESASRTILNDGDEVLFRDEWTGRQWIGHAWHNINNMWWVLLPGGVVRNEASFQLLPAAGDAQPGRTFPLKHIEKRLRAELDKAVKGERFERASVLRDILRVRFPAKREEQAVPA